MRELPYRQIHLDFHTSPFIPDVGTAFDAGAFAATLKEARVDSINLFAKCHHGMSYYPTKVGRMHPSLTFDLFGGMVKAVNDAGIQAVAYVPVGWEEDAADRADWLEVPSSGVLGGKKPFEDGHYRWRKLCLNKPDYIDYTIRQSEEIVDNYKIAGFWYDIIFQEQCVCRDCIASMRKLGLDPANPDDVLKHDFHVLRRFQERLTAFVRSRLPDGLVFYNGMWRPDGGYDPAYSITERKKLQSHVEIESLPSEVWGYNHFPVFVNYHNRHNEELVGMNGKFHTAWGDFGSIRNKEALEFECFRMIANGSKISIGDQMHPRGYLDPAVYERIGEVYRQIEEREPWCAGSTKLSQIGVLTSNRPLQVHSDADEGVMRMLFELHYTFDFLDVRDDFSGYELLILPDDIPVNRQLADKIAAYMKQGGKLLASHLSGIDPESGEFSIPELGVSYVRPNDYEPSYLLPMEPLIGGGIEAYEYVLYERGSYVRPAAGTEMMAMLGSAYFNRSYEKFSSHRHTPFDKRTEYPAVVRNGNAFYIAHPVFTDYIKHGPRVYRSLVERLLKLLLPQPLVATDLPVSAELTVREQKGHDRVVVHLLHYIAERKARKLDIVDTKLPIYGSKLVIRSVRRPAEVYLAPAAAPLAFDWASGSVAVTVPELNGHAMVVLQY